MTTLVVIQEPPDPAQPEWPSKLFNQPILNQHALTSGGNTTILNLIRWQFLKGTLKLEVGIAYDQGLFSTFSQIFSEYWISYGHAIGIGGQPVNPEDIAAVGIQKTILLHFPGEKEDPSRTLLEDTEGNRMKLGLLICRSYGLGWIINAKKLPHNLDQIFNTITNSVSQRTWLFWLGFIPVVFNLVQ